MGVPKAGHLHSNWGTPGTVTSSSKWGAAFLGGCRCLVLLKTRPRAPKELENPSFMTSKTWKGWSDSWKWLPLPELRLSASTSLAGFPQKPSFRSEVDGGVFQGLGRKQFVQHEGANRREAEAPGARSSCLLWCLGCSTSVGSKRGSWWNVALVWHSLSLSTPTSPPLRKSAMASGTAVQPRPVCWDRCTLSATKSWPPDVEWGFLILLTLRRDSRAWLFLSVCS